MKYKQLDQSKALKTKPCNFGILNRTVHISQRAGDFLFGADHPYGLDMQMEKKDSGMRLDSNVPCNVNKGQRRIFADDAQLTRRLSGDVPWRQRGPSLFNQCLDSSLTPTSRCVKTSYSIVKSCDFNNFLTFSVHQFVHL